VIGSGNSPGELLVRIAKEYHVDMIVMGARGMGKIKKAFLGSVSDYVMKKARVPVLICQWGST
jgi:nucleotide-binding universal stress UspA family protein